MKKLLALFLLCTPAAWACGVGYGPELPYLVVGVVVVACIPMMAAPLLGMLLARKRGCRFQLGAGLSLPVGWAVSVAATTFLGVPGYFVGLVASVLVSMAISGHFQVSKDAEPSNQIGFTPAH